VNQAKLRTPLRRGHRPAYQVQFTFPTMAVTRWGWHAPAWASGELTVRALQEKHADTDYKKGHKREAKGV